MEITFEEDYLRELYYEGKAHNKKYRFQPQIIKKYVRVIDLMASLNSTADFYRYKALHYEVLVGDKKDREYLLESMTNIELSFTLKLLVTKNKSRYAIY